MKARSWLFLLMLSILPLVDLLHPGIPAGHDTPDHVARIANFYQSLSDGNITPRWAGNLNWGYGHPILMFLYPLPSYLASLFRMIGFSFVDATKLVFAISYIASILAMYWWAKSAWGKLPGLVAAILYGFAPYRFVDLYVRGALGEHVAFVFPPLIFLGLHKLAKGEKPQWWGALISVAVAGLILSHNAVSLMFLSLIFLYGMYLWLFEAKNKLRFLVLSSWFVVCGFIVSAFFWVPAFLEGKYTLRDIVTRGEFAGRFVLPLWFLWSAWNYGGGNEFTKQLGIAQWMGILGVVAVWFRTKERKTRWFIGGSLAILLGTLFLMTKNSLSIWQTITLLQKFQFPWRFLTIAVFIASASTAVWVAHLPKKFVFLISVLLMVISLLNTAAMWQAKDYIQKPESYYSGVCSSTTDTGESSPIWSVRFMERRADAPMEVIEGEAKIEAISRNSTKHSYQVDVAQKSRLVENTLYFPRWRIFIDGVEASVEFQDPNQRGLLTFWIEPGIHQVVVQFGDTKLRKAANGISILGAILFLGFIGTMHLWQKRPSR